MEEKHKIKGPKPLRPISLAAGLYWGVFSLMLFGAGCDASFDPFERDARYYSVFGYIDAGADTQFVRISPIRESVAQSAEPIDATVTLANLQTGETFIYRDSLFAYAEGNLALNYWSDAQIAHGGAYTFSVARSDGAVSTVSLVMPDTFAAPVLTAPAPLPFQEPEDLEQEIRVTGLSRVADIQVHFFLAAFPGDERARAPVIVSYLSDVQSVANGYRVRFNAYNDLLQIIQGTCPYVQEVRAFVASAGPDWPDLSGIDNETLARPDVVSNVEHGVGYLGSIASQTIVWNDLADILNDVLGCGNKR